MTTALPLPCAVPDCKENALKNTSRCQGHQNGPTESYVVLAPTATRGLIAESDLRIIENSDRKLNDLATAASSQIRECESLLSEHVKFQFWSKRITMTDDNGQLWSLGWAKFAEVWRLAVLSPTDETRLLDSSPRLVRILAAKHLPAFVAETAMHAETNLNLALK